MAVLFFSAKIHIFIIQISSPRISIMFLPMWELRKVDFRAILSFHSTPGNAPRHSASRFELRISRATGTARRFRDQIPGEGTEEERSGGRAAQMGEVGEIMISCPIPEVQTAARKAWWSFQKKTRWYRDYRVNGCANGCTAISPLNFRCRG